MAKIRFITRPPQNVGRVFENVYEEALREDDETLTYLHRVGRGMWLYVDSALAAETIGIAPSRLREELPDTALWRDEKFNTSCLYMYATTVRKEFQGQGYGKLLCAYYAGFMKASGFSQLIGHATSDEMRGIRAWQGAEFRTEHADWFGSGRKAVFYALQL